LNLVSTEPRSLLWRLGMLALAVTVVSFVLHVAVITMLMRPLGEKLASHLAARIELVHALLESTPTAGRDAAARSAADEDFLPRRQLPGDEQAPTEPPPPVGPLLVNQLGSGYQVGQVPSDARALPPRLLWVGFVVDGEPWRVEVRLQPPTQVLLGTGIGWLMLAAAAVAASLLVGLRFIVEPIRQTAERIASQGAAMRTLAVPAGASTELRSLVETFNRLADRMHVADRTKQQLLAGVSHDLRTPLARLRLRIETQCAPAVAEAAEAELRAVEHIVSQFLAFVHGDSGAGLGPTAPLTATAQRVVAAYAERGDDVGWHASADDMPIGATALQRLLGNLVDNALAYGRSPVQVRWTDGVPGERELGVWDQGPGLTEAQFKAALEPFVRLSSQPALGHCGLGLAIVAQIAQQCGGRLGCRRDAGHGFGIVVSWGASRAPPS
jgi:two-component system, OmpR family, osmolarity sensor histidine kinase EnvZ